MDDDDWMAKIGSDPKLAKSLSDAVWAVAGPEVDDVRIDVERLHDRITALQARIDKLERAHAACLSPERITELAYEQTVAALSAALERKEASHDSQA
jgi:hypothetical protein